MKIISHRGNITEVKTETENNPKQILKVLNLGFDVEIDVWYVNGNYFLGHDRPQYEINKPFLLSKSLWIHAKNIDALHKLHKSTNCFYHNTDDAVLTSHNFIWVYPGKPLVKNCISLLFNNTIYPFAELNKCYAICTDNIVKWDNIFNR